MDIKGKGAALEKHLLIFGMVFNSLRDVNTAVMELLIMAYALKTSCARNIIGVIPYFPYSKQSKMRKRGSIVCKLLASMLAKAGECHRAQQRGRLACCSASICWASQRASVLLFFSHSMWGCAAEPLGHFGGINFLQLNFISLYLTPGEMSC